MPRRSVPSGHIYSVFVDSVTAEGTLATEHIYFGNSKFAAQVKLAQAITDNPHAYQIDLRCDMRLVARVRIERPG